MTESFVMNLIRKHEVSCG